MAKGKYEYWLTPEGLIKLEGWARDGLTDEQIAVNIGVNRDTLYRWKKAYSDISDALKKGKDVIDRQVVTGQLAALGHAVAAEQAVGLAVESLIAGGRGKAHHRVEHIDRLACSDL